MFPLFAVGGVLFQHPIFQSLETLIVDTVLIRGATGLQGLLPYSVKMLILQLVNG